VSAALIEAPPTLPALWIDGRPQAVDGAHVSAFDRGLLLADGVFETMRVHRATAFRSTGTWRGCTARSERSRSRRRPRSTAGSTPHSRPRGPPTRRSASR
jgi:hypothetical protein